MQKSRPLIIWDLVRGITLLCALLTSGAGLGYWYAVTTQAVRHQTDLEAARADYKLALDVLAGRLSQTVEQVTEVADAVATAAQTAQDAAGTADIAAAKASKAASKVVVPMPAPKPVPRADNRAINQAVNAANSEIKGR